MQSKLARLCSQDLMPMNAITTRAQAGDTANKKANIILMLSSDLAMAEEKLENKVGILPTSAP